MSKTIVKVNVMGTWRQRAPTATDATDLTEKNKAGYYWNRENSEGYKVAMDIHRNNLDTVRDPSKQSLYEFVRQYSDNWKLHGEDKVPHVIPSFRSVSKRGGQNKERYLMFLRALLLMHKPGSTFNQVSLLDQPQLEVEASDFSMLPNCPNVVTEEYDQSQLDEEDDEEGFDGVDDNEQPLLVQPELEQGPNIHENWQELLGPMVHHDEPHVEDGEADYDKQDMNNEDYDWQEDSRLLGLSEQDKLELPGWINMTKIFEDVEEDNAVVGGLPENLNPKQLLAYKIICNHTKWVIEDKEKGTMNTPQLLLNISGAAGTGKGFWPNTVRRYIKSKPQLHKTFIKYAAPSGTTAFLIGGETLHGLLYLPVS
jgi:hypothetical protein